jgi:hypothetical protein
MEPPFELDDLLRRYGSRRKKFEPIYEGMLEEAKSLTAPRSLQRTYQTDAFPIFATILPGADTLTFGLCSIGPGLDYRVAELFSSDPVSAVVLDEIGTQWVKGLAREMHQEIRAMAQEMGKQASPSFRPGIGRWPLDLQEELFAGLPTASIGVSYQNGVMDPQKSISMIVAVGASLGRSLFAPQSNRKAI